jgi:hypothetical protein
MAGVKRYDMTLVSITVNSENQLSYTCVEKKNKFKSYDFVSVNAVSIAKMPATAGS